MKRIVVLSAVLLVVLVPLAASAKPTLGEIKVPMVYDPTTRAAHRGAVFGVTQAGNDTFYYGGTVWDAVDGRWEAAVPTAAGWVNREMWTWSAYGFNTTLHSGENMDGWTSVDSTAYAADKFRVKSTAEIGSCVIAGNKSLLCGLDNIEATEQEWADTWGTGYGHNWNETVVTRSYSYALGNDITLTYDFTNDTEPGFDSTYVILQTFDCDLAEWTNYATLAVYTGGPYAASAVVDIDSCLSGVSDVDFRIKFHFESDGVWDDEDGMYSTVCGACVFDNYALTGAVTDSEDFETVAVGSVPSGWQVIAPDPCGDFAKAEHINDLPIGLDQDPCVAANPGLCEIADSVITFNDPLSPGNPHPYCQYNYIMSPVIDLSDHLGLPGRFLSFERLADLPLYADVFMMWMVRYRPYAGPAEWSRWLDDNTLYHSPVPTCTRMDFDVSSYVPTSAQQVQVALVVVNKCLVWPFFCVLPSNATPYYDNVTFGVYGSGNAPYISMQEYNYWQDQFAQDGTLNSASTADTRTALNLAHFISEPVDEAHFGDSLVCRGEADGMAVYLVFRMAEVGPGQDTATHPFFTTRFPTVTSGAWQEARMDTAELTCGMGTCATQGIWMAAFHELDPNYPGYAGEEILPNDLFVPGTRIEYFLKSQYVGSPDSYLLPDTTGGFCEEFEVLPMMRDDGEGGVEWPSLIVVDHFGQRGNGGERNSDRIACHLVANDVDFDMYNKLAPTSKQGNGIGRTDPYETRFHPGASIEQMLGYTHCIMNTGGAYDACVEEQDVVLLREWLRDPMSPELVRFLWLSGDQVCEELSDQVWSYAFLDSFICVDVDASTYSYTYSDYTYCLPMVGLAGGRLECGDPESYVVRENCRRTFNVYALPSSPACNAVPEIEYDYQVPAAIAAISNAVNVVGGLHHKTFTEGYDFCLMRDSDSQGPPECASDDFISTWIACVLNWAGLTNIGVTEPGVMPAFVTSLSQSFPNPMNPTAEIHYSIGSPGKVRLTIFDVSGRVVRTLVEEVKAAGEYSVAWDGRNDRGKRLGSGVFFYQLEASDFRSAKKIVVVK